MSPDQVREEVLQNLEPFAKCRGVQDLHDKLSSGSSGEAWVLINACKCVHVMKNWCFHSRSSLAAKACQAPCLYWCFLACLLFIAWPGNWWQIEVPQVAPRVRRFLDWLCKRMSSLHSRYRSLFCNLIYTFDLCGRNSYSSCPSQQRPRQLSGLDGKSQHLVCKDPVGDDGFDLCLLCLLACLALADSRMMQSLFLHLMICLELSATKMLATIFPESCQNKISRNQLSICKLQISMR